MKFKWDKNKTKNEITNEIKEGHSREKNSHLHEIKFKNGNNNRQMKGNKYDQKRNVFIKQQQ